MKKSLIRFSLCAKISEVKKIKSRAYKLIKQISIDVIAMIGAKGGKLDLRNTSYSNIDNH